MSRQGAHLLLLGLSGFIVLLSGCNIVSAVTLLTKPTVYAPAEFKPKGKLAVVIDYSRLGLADPVFERALHERIVRLFREHKVEAEVVPHERVTRLQATSAEFGTWSIQRIGRELGADLVLYVRIDELRLRPGREVVVTPAVAMRLKLVDVSAPAVHAVVWPDRNAEPEGRGVRHQRPPIETDQLSALDDETVKLARETAYYVARHFYRYDTETNPPRER